jgi:hypothetical protein
VIHLLTLNKNFGDVLLSNVKFVERLVIGGPILGSVHMGSPIILRSIHAISTIESMEVETHHFPWVPRPKF